MAESLGCFLSKQRVLWSLQNAAARSHPPTVRSLIAFLFDAAALPGPQEVSGVGRADVAACGRMQLALLRSCAMCKTPLLPLLARQALVVLQKLEQIGCPAVLPVVSPSSTTATNTCTSLFADDTVPAVTRPGWWVISSARQRLRRLHVAAPARVCTQTMRTACRPGTRPSLLHAHTNRKPLPPAWSGPTPRSGTTAATI